MHFRLLDGGHGAPRDAKHRRERAFMSKRADDETERRIFAELAER
jgi:hypothetical protein